MLHPPGIVVPDWPPPFRFALAGHPQQARTFEPFISCGFSDAEAWEALFTDTQRLDTFRVLYGNRKGPVKRRKPKQAALDFEAAG